MRIEAASVDDYIQQAPDERRDALTRLREVINDNLPDGFSETLGYGMPAWVVPQDVYPDGYHCDPSKPLPFLNFASQTNHIALYHMGLYANEELMTWFKAAWSEHSDRRLDMGKSCIRFKKPEHIPFALIGELVSKMSADDWIRLYEANVRR